LRIWDLEPAELSRKHLLGEHNELHAMWTILTQGRRGYSRHPETLRWTGKLAALDKRHDALTEEMLRRGYRHNSPLDKSLATGEPVQSSLLASIEEQRALLAAKDRGCPHSGTS
jgi:hypothetical protein